MKTNIAVENSGGTFTVIIPQHFLMLKDVRLRLGVGER
jgi:hypothetical protein